MQQSALGQKSEGFSFVPKKRGGADIAPFGILEPAIQVASGPRKGNIPPE
jgi:hypothetical protein